MSSDVTFTVWAKHLEAEVTFFDVHFPEDKAFLNEVLNAVLATLTRKIDFDPENDSAGWLIKNIKRDGALFWVNSHSST